MYIWRKIASLFLGFTIQKLYNRKEKNHDGQRVTKVLFMDIIKVHNGSVVESRGQSQAKRST